MLAFFLYLVWEARFQDSGQPTGLLGLFFDLNPFLLLATFLSTHTFVAGMLLGLVTVAVTVLLGRVFCGWFCPFGTIHAFASWAAQKLRRERYAAQPHSRWQHTKYYLLIALLVMAAFGVQWVGVVDPFSILYRSTAVAVAPGAQKAISDGSKYVWDADPHVGPLHLTSVTEPVYRFFRDKVFIVSQPAFLGSTLIFAVFIALVLLNAYRTRFWCRYLCPLGGMLGLLSRRTLLRLTQDKDTCNNCGRCQMACPAGAQPEQPDHWLQSECYACWNCVAACNFKGLHFTLGSPFRAPSEEPLDLGKRAVLLAGAGGAAGMMTLRLTPQAHARMYNPGLIRPPGARAERAFNQRCVQCGICMKVCPTNGLQPAFLEAGLEGLWTPMLVPQVGYCEYSCNLCGQVCPTEAIQPLPLEEKKQVKLGMAVFDTTRCLPHAYKRECLVCEEHCPIPNKAIYFIPTEIKMRDGSTATIKQPFVDPELCIGCGVCEWSCVFEDAPAVRVTSANETRHPGNQPILPGSAGGGAYGGAVDQSGSDPYGSAGGESDPYGSAGGGNGGAESDGSQSESSSPYGF